MTGEREQRAKVGVFGIGLDAYWEQFDGLKERLEGYQHSVEERMDNGRRSSPQASWIPPRRLTPPVGGSPSRE